MNQEQINPSNGYWLLYDLSTTSCAVAKHSSLGNMLVVFNEIGDGLAFRLFTGREKTSDLHLYDEERIKAVVQIAIDAGITLAILNPSAHKQTEEVTIFDLQVFLDTGRPQYKQLKVI